MQYFKSLATEKSKKGCKDQESIQSNTLLYFTRRKNVDKFDGA